MPKIAYVPKSFQQKSLALIEQANGFIARYNSAITLRQLYYRLVANDIIPNTPKSYDNLGSLINDARLAGLVDWNAIQDRTRNLRKLGTFENPSEVISAAEHSYHVNWWDGQEVRVEVWIEKDALVGVIEDVCEELDVPYFSCRGYTSQSEMWGAAMRIINRKKHEQQNTVILHLGDHDPSGIDMTRDITERLDLFCGHHGFSSSIDVKRIALTMEQIEQYNPPPNPAKVTDTRANAYIAEHGDESWELDALEPDVIVELIRENVQEYIDEETMNDRKEYENEGKELLTKCSDNWTDVAEHIQENY